MSENLGGIYIDIELESAQLLDGARKVNEALSGMGSNAGKASGNFDGVGKSANSAGKSIARSADDASQAAKVMERLGNEVAILEEANEKGAKSAAVLAAQLAASKDASSAQIKEIGNLAAALFEAKTAATESAKAISSSDNDLRKTQSTIKSLEESLDGAITGMESGARAAAILSSQLRAGENATEAERAKISLLAGSLYDVKKAASDAAKSISENNAAYQRAESYASSLENSISVLGVEQREGARSAAILSAQLQAGSGATETQRAKISQLAGKLYDLKAAQDEASAAANKAAQQAAQQANNAAKLRSMHTGLVQQLALLNEAQVNGERSAAMLAARLQAGSSATAAQRKEIGELAGKLYDLKHAQDQTNTSQQKSTGIMGGLKTGLTAIASAMAISQLVQYGKQFIDIADAMTQLQARIYRLSSSAKEGSATLQALSDIASSSGSSLKETASLWEKLTSSLKGAGASNTQILALTDTLQKIGRIGGSSSEEMSNALRQFGQSIDGGVIRAQEFNSILEQMPELSRQMAAGLGISVGELRKRMLEGKLSAEDALNAISNRTGAVNQEFSKLPRTTEQATNSLTISFQGMVKQMNDATGASTGMVHVIDSVTAAIDRLSGRIPNATQQISDLNSTADMFARRARTYSWLGLDGWSAQAEGINAVSNKAANLIGDLAAISKASASASKQPIKVSGTGDSKEMEKLEKSTKRKLELSKLEGEARARLQAQYDAEDAGITDSNRIKALKDEYAATEKNTSARKSSTAEGKKAATQAESDSKKLEILRQKSQQVADTTQELSRSQAILNAQQSLSKSATPAMIQQAGDYAAKIWDQNNALKQQAQIKQGQKFAQQEIVSAQIMPDAQTGAVQNPTARIDLQEQQKLAALAKYQAIDTQNTQLYEDAKTAIQQEASNDRRKIAENESNMQSQAITSIIGSVSQGLDGLANLASTAAGKSSGAYQAMFALSKGFAVAQAALNLQLAISQAMADPTALTPAQKLANYAAIASAGASMLSTIGSISYGGGRENGGPVSADSMYRVGEGGKPEIFKASNGNQYMIPGDNGSVISNKDIGGAGGGGTSIQQENHFHITTTGGIDDATKAWIIKNMKQVALYEIKDQSSRPKGMIQPRKKR